MNIETLFSLKSQIDTAWRAGQCSVHAENGVYVMEHWEHLYSQYFGNPLLQAYSLQAKSLIVQDPMLSQYIITNDLANLGFSFLGAGGSNMVVHDWKTDAAIAIAYDNYDPSFAHGIMQLHKILSTLMPNNFAKLHALIQGPDTVINGTIREFVSGPKPSIEATRTLGDHYERFFANIGMPVTIDSHSGNFRIVNDQLVYIDLIDPYEYNWQNPRVIEYMHDNNYPQAAIQTVRESLAIILDNRPW